MTASELQLISGLRKSGTTLFTNLELQSSVCRDIPGRPATNTAGSEASLINAIEKAEALPASASDSSKRSKHRRQIGTCSYFVLNFIVVALLTAAAVLPWSEMGCGHSCIGFLRQHHRFWLLCGLVVMLVLIVLYLLDFFCPPHMPGMYFTLTKDGSPVATFFLGVAIVALLLMVLLLAKTVPVLPLLATVFLCPVGVLLLRKITVPRDRDIEGRRYRHAKAIASKSSTDHRSFKLQMSLLKLIKEEESDHKKFYCAATGAFVISGLLCYIVWQVWVVKTRGGNAAENHDSFANEFLDIRWNFPLLVAISDVVFACFMGLRVALNRTYSATNEVKNQLIVGGNRCEDEQLTRRRISELQEQLAANTSTRLQDARDKMQQQLIQHILYMRQLSKIVKALGCAFAVVLAGIYIAFQLRPQARDNVVFLVQGSFMVYLFTFILVIFVSFGRLWEALGTRTKDLSIVKSLISVTRMNWARAFFLCLMCPFIPVVLSLSCLNQIVRKWRGLVKDESDANSCLTARMNKFLRAIRAWDRLKVMFWCYVVSTVLIIYVVVPILLNVLLAWMSSLFANLSYGAVLGGIFGAGMFLFMLPPVPGPPIYIFSGLISARTCPWGYETGIIICIVLNFFLKLTACAVQQKLIGEQLGGLQSVRATVGVHQPLIRAIEKILQRPGLSFGKCMILCGGPDWPTSVMAGILRLSLLQCLVGTCPILLNLVPMTLSGSFYLRREDGPVWKNAGNFMLVLSVFSSVFFWIGMGWAVQDAFENEKDITLPKEEYVDLEWLDHRSSVISERCAISWKDLPNAVRALYAIGACGLMAVGLIFLWRKSIAFGNFKAQDDITTLRWFGRSMGLIKPVGTYGLIVAAVSYFCIIPFVVWSRRRTRNAKAEISQELNRQEASWKEQRARAAREVSTSVASPRGFGSSDLHLTEVRALIQEAGSPRSGSGFESPMSLGSPFRFGVLSSDQQEGQHTPNVNLEQAALSCLLTSGSRASEVPTRRSQWSRGVQQATLVAALVNATPVQFGPEPVSPQQCKTSWEHFATSWDHPPVVLSKKKKKGTKKEQTNRAAKAEDLATVTEPRRFSHTSPLEAPCGDDGCDPESSESVPMASCMHGDTVQLRPMVRLGLPEKPSVP